MKRSLFYNIVAIAGFVVLVSCAGKSDDNQETGQTSSLNVDTPVTDQTHQKEDINLEPGSTTTEHTEGIAQPMGESKVEGETEKGNQSKPDPGNTEVVKHGSDNQAKLDSIKNAKQRQRGN